jgi:hypothetical protein
MRVIHSLICTGPRKTKRHLWAALCSKIERVGVVTEPMIRGMLLEAWRLPASASLSAAAISLNTKIREREDVARIGLLRIDGRCGGLEI